MGDRDVTRCRSAHRAGIAAWVLVLVLGAACTHLIAPSPGAAPDRSEYKVTARDASEGGPHAPATAAPTVSPPGYAQGSGADLAPASSSECDEFELLRVAKNASAGKVHLTLEQLGASTRVRLVRP